jgi:mono/diheme cytochrome c family protein
MNALRGLLLALLLTTPAIAADLPDPKAARGLAIAREWCASCHKVEDRQTEATDAAPTFASIARQPDRTSSFVRAWLINPHPPMPKLELSRADVDALMAYFESLRQAQR